MRPFQIKSLWPNLLKGFKNRVNFSVGMLTATRPTSMNLLCSHQLVKMELGSDVVWKITEKVGSVNGGSKKSYGGWKEIGRNPVEDFLYDSHEAGKMNFFQDLDEYLQIRNNVAVDLDRFFSPWTCERLQTKKPF